VGLGWWGEVRWLVGWGGWQDESATRELWPYIRFKFLSTSSSLGLPWSHLPPYLPASMPTPTLPALQYAVYRKPAVFNAICKLAMLLSTAVLILGVVLVWLLYPRSYDYKQVRRCCWRRGHCMCALRCAMHVQCSAGGGGGGGGGEGMPCCWV
jgi:hypothetical protein